METDRMFNRRMHALPVWRGHVLWLLLGTAQAPQRQKPRAPGPGRAHRSNVVVHYGKNTEVTRSWYSGLNEEQTTSVFSAHIIL